MSELDEVLKADLKAAIEHAKAENRFELADYLSLKSSNDKIRLESIRWLFEAILEIVRAFNAHGAGIEIERKDNHRFKFGATNLSGSLLKFRKGVRSLSLEAGWTQSAGDGFMRGGALACAQISHFGFAKMKEELVLVKFENHPQWFSVVDEKRRASFTMQGFRKHFEVFLG